MWSIAFVAVGVLAWIGAAMHWRRVSVWLRRAARTGAEVVRLEGSMPGQDLPPAGQINEKMTVFPVVRFTDAGGATHECRARMGMPYRTLKDRATLDITYDPESPEDVRLGANADRGLATTLAGMGTIVVILGVVGLLR
tara:strand:- start:333 stop:749 length:417 start_codon:yes stop_codon:yes gene_type:complete